MKVLICSILFISAGFTSGYGQYKQHHADSSAHPGEHHQQKTEKGPNHGRMALNNGLKIEMATPSNTKKTEVTYYVFDSLTNPLDAKLYPATVKYIFGGANQYLQVKLVPTGKINQYVATLEGWNEYKKAIVVVKANNQTYTFTFHNNVIPPSQSQSGNNSNNQGGHHHGNGHNTGGGGMGGGGTGGGNGGRGF